jgi:hypothetical protein
MLALRVQASEAALVVIIVAIENTLQAGWNPKGACHGQRKGRKEGENG